jgi:hypothetical protein
VVAKGLAQEHQTNFLLFFSYFKSVNMENESIIPSIFSLSIMLHNLTLENEITLERYESNYVVRLWD